MNSPSPLLAQITNAAIVIAVACAFIAGIVLFIQAVVPSCKEASNLPPYESFASSADVNAPILSGAKNRIERIRAVKAQLEADLESLSTSADDVCAILKQVEDAYVQNSAAPSSEDEYSLPKDVQERRMADRRRRAVVGFKERQKQYVALNGNKPLYECFASNEEVANALDDLNVEVKELTAIMDTAEVKMATVKGDQIRSLLGFNAGYLKKAIGGITAPAPKEGFADSSKLFAKADELIGKALALHTMVVELRRDVELQQKAAGGVDRKAGDLMNGNVTEGDKSAAIARGF
jgi:hypothetical protein